MKLRDHDHPCEHEADEFYGGHADQNYERGHVILGPLVEGESRWCPGGAEVEAVSVPWCETCDEPITLRGSEHVVGDSCDVRDDLVFRIGGDDD